MTKPIKVDDEAADELTAAYTWYEDQVRGLGDALIAAVNAKLLRVQLAPRRAALAPGVPPRLNVRRALLRGFPFAVFFIELEDEIRVLAVAHQRRRPGYWRRRVRKQAH